MKNRLRILLIHLPHPYPKEKQSAFEEWGKLSITIIQDNHARKLLEIDWNLLPFLQWFEENKAHLFSESFACKDLELYALDSESLSLALDRAQKREFLENETSLEDAWYDFIYQFRCRHSLHFALRGTKTPPITIGRHRGHGEISLSGEDETWSYLFDIQDFLYNACRTIETFKKSGRDDNE